MNIENYIAISSLPGLYTMVASKPNGLLVKDLKGGKTKFCSLRKYEFTPLETVGIYTMTDTEDLKTIFTAMKSLKTIPAPKSSKDELIKFFGEVLPTFDRDKVFPNHISKIIKWFNELEEHGFLETTEVKKDTKKGTASKKASVKKKAPTKKVTAKKTAVRKTSTKKAAVKKTSSKNK